ncbi:MAG: L-aspartate oxidase [Planctomycetes bacterium]|nr:L-aspartate oxidase [Planctomycetota bacterium]
MYTDCLVIGGGVAGLRSALGAVEGGQVIVLTKDKVTECNTHYAQGGIAAAIYGEESIASHIDDTLKTGCGLCDEKVVEFVVRGGVAQLEQLRDWSVPLDLKDGQLTAAREGGHVQPRVFHALGDATGRALLNSLVEQVKLNPGIKLFDHCFVIDLLTEGNACYGVLCYHPQHGLQCIWARKTVLAAGGAGQLYRETTNAAGATADGLAMAYRAGAVLSDLELVQFHPTTLYIAGAARSLITEALRGAGATLVDKQGNRFMEGYHKVAELAPRDVVCRAIYSQMARSKTTNVYLDVRHLGSEYLERRFPTISKLCKSFDIDVDRDLIPVRPSAHYMIGGVKTDIEGLTNIENLYCCGEAAATGLHGANRLASNSLLEGMVFGEVCGRNVAREIRENNIELERRTVLYDIPPSDRTPLDVVDVTNSLRALMWRNVGVERSQERLDETLEIIDFWRRYVMDKVWEDPVGWECQNMLTMCRLMVDSARRRQESRGVHYRLDFPQRDDEAFGEHIDVVRD